MILVNEDYADQGMDSAVRQNSLILTQDKDGWFYKKWRGLTESLGEEGKLESRLEGHLRYMKDLYRASCERSIIPYPTGVPFAVYKEKMEKGERKDPVYDNLLEVFRRLPKGGLLHVHSAAALSVEGLIALLEEWDDPAIFIETEGRFAGKMDYQQPEDPAGTKMALSVFLEYVGAENRLKEWLTVGAHTDHVPYIWDAFNQIFMRTSDLFENRNFYFEYHRRFFLECMRDRIDYVELRCGFQNFTSHENWIQHDVIVDQRPEFLDVLTAARDAAVEAYQQEAAGQGWRLPGGNMELGVILCARRDLDAEIEKDKEKLMKKIDTAVCWKLGAYQELIRGFDFVSEEDRGKASYTYYKDIFYGAALDGYSDEACKTEFAALRARYKEQTEGKPRIRLIELMLHAGESLWMEQENIVDAMIASRYRLGHGFQLLEYPGALTGYQFGPRSGMMEGPVLEVCPSSNQMLRYFPDIRNHYALMLMKLGVPCVIANDDPQILGNPGLSYDFWEMYMASDGGLMLMKGLVFTAYLFQYQARVGISFAAWDNEVYEACLQSFERLYWMPYLKEMSVFFGDPEEQGRML